MKKLISLFIVFLISCSSTTEVESFEVNKESTTTSITTASTTTTILDGDTPFNIYWRDNKLVSYPPLTDEEIEISTAINQNKISYIQLGDGTSCIKKTGGTLDTARINEYDPINPRTIDEWGFIVQQVYTCDSYSISSLYGDFFFQDGTWWTFAEISQEEKLNLDENGNEVALDVWKFATRINLGPDLFNGNFECRADADYIEHAYEQSELDSYYYYKDIEIDYSTPTTIEQLENRIELLEKSKDYYEIALSVRLGYRFGTVEDLKPENSYIDAVLYGMIVNLEDNLEAKYAMRDYLVENGPFESNSDEVDWWTYNSKYSAVEWRTTVEFVEFFQGKLEPFEGVGNHIVNPEDLPNPDWVISEDYPRKTLRKYCTTYFTDLDPYHTGRYDLREFLATNTYASIQKDEELFRYYSGQNGPLSGEYLYKDWEDEINIDWCQDEGFSKEECETTASFTWENKNNFYVVEFTGLSCAEQMNKAVSNYFESYKDRNQDAAKPAPGMIGSAYESITFYVPKLSQSLPETLFSFGVIGYYASGGTMRYPYWDSFTFDLRSCEQVTYNEVIDIDNSFLEEKILEYVLYSESDSNEYIISSYRFDKNYFIESAFLSDSALYIPFINCGVYCWWHVFVNDADELAASQKEYEQKYGRCSEPGYFEVECNSSLTNKFSGFLAIPLNDLGFND